MEKWTNLGKSSLIPVAPYCNPELSDPKPKAAQFNSEVSSVYTGSFPNQMPPHAYVEWKGCLRGSFPRLGAYTGASTCTFEDHSSWSIQINQTGKK